MILLFGTSVLTTYYQPHLAKVFVVKAWLTILYDFSPKRTSKTFLDIYYISVRKEVHNVCDTIKTPILGLFYVATEET